MRFKNIHTDKVFIKRAIIENEGIRANIVHESLGMLRKIEILELEGIDEEIRIKYIDSFSEMELYFNRSLLALVQVLETSKLQSSGELSLRILIFSMPLKNIYENLYVKIGDKLKEKWLRPRDFMLSLNHKKYIAIACGNATKDSILLDEGQRIQKELEKLKKQKNKALQNNENVDELDKDIKDLESRLKDITSGELEELDNLAFSIVSDSGILAVEKVNLSQDELIFKATKLMPIKEKIMQGLQLVKLKKPLEFKDGSVRASVGDLLDSNELVSKYLETWDKYWSVQGELLLKRAREIGEVEIDGVDDDFSLKVKKDLREKLDEGDFICIMHATPPYLQDENLDFKSYIQQHIQIEKIKSDVAKNEIKTYKIENVSSNKIWLERFENLSLKDSGLERGAKFSLSIIGDFTSLKRQYKARQRMLEGKSANPILPMIFASEISEELKETLREQKKNAIPALIDKVRAKIFSSNPPTPNQEEAIRMAINTPDIAIIQGPPGTGKTTVLNAIIERLNELNDKDISKRGSIFIGAFQHSAVENLISRMNLNGLPVPKFGSRQNSLNLSSVEHIKNWAEQIASRLEIKPDSELIKKFKNLSNSYIDRPSLSKQKELLKTIANTSTPALKEPREQAREMLDELEKRLGAEKSANKEKDLALIYALRENAKSFSDDGLLQNRALLNSEIAEMLSEGEKQILKKESFSEDLVNLKKELVKRFSPVVKFEKEKENRGLIDLTASVLDSLKNLDLESKINTLLAEFKDKLLGNPYALQDVIEDYSVAFGATTGQSSKSDILKAKGIIESNEKDYEKYEYDNVIIDEAAMISPLDLFLVLVLARQRIILVGDHRQLPHMLNEEVLKNLDSHDFGLNSSQDSSEATLLKDSLFSFLKTRALELEKIDSTKRFITLNNQYRTHELLGNLVSDIFYKEHEEGYASPLGARGFSHNLKGIENTPAVWLDLPKECGRESMDGTSRARECEVQLIVEKLCEWISSEAGWDFSYGVISFYSAQVRLIKERLKEAGESFSDELQERLERVKVGSVDSFQGMEFDVVFLSPVRCGDFKMSPEIANTKKAFGFLAVPNRLCVSMSRQKKCLIVAGDKAYFQSEMAKKYVRGLYEFAKLCEERGKVLIGEALLQKANFRANFRVGRGAK